MEDLIEDLRANKATPEQLYERVLCWMLERNEAGFVEGLWQRLQRFVLHEVGLADLCVWKYLYRHHALITAAEKSEKDSYDAAIYTAAVPFALSLVPGRSRLVQQIDDFVTMKCQCGTTHFCLEDARDALHQAIFYWQQSPDKARRAHRHPMSYAYISYF
jgi:hypothetical protein